MENKDWLKKKKHIEKEFVFSDFRKAMAFMLEVSYLAEEMDHHPEWCNVYNRVNIKLTTHDTGGISEKDHILAKKIDQLI